MLVRVVKVKVAFLRVSILKLKEKGDCLWGGFEVVNWIAMSLGPGAIVFVEESQTSVPWSKSHMPREEENRYSIEVPDITKAVQPELSLSQTKR